jgi:hypothetical protein
VVPSWWLTSGPITVANDILRRPALGRPPLDVRTAGLPRRTLFANALWTSERIVVSPKVDGTRSELLEFGAQPTAGCAAADGLQCTLRRVDPELAADASQILVPAASWSARCGDSPVVRLRFPLGDHLSRWRLQASGRVGNWSSE